MPTLMFRGAYIRFVDLRYEDAAKVPFIKIKMTADLSEPVMKAMQWGEPQEGITGAALIGDLAAAEFKLIPNGLQQYEISMSATRLHNFQLAESPDTTSDKRSFELRFELVTTDKKAGRNLHDYLAIVGKGVGQLRVKYEEQSELEQEAADAAEGRQQPLISEEQAADTAESGDETPKPRGRSKARLKVLN